MSLNILVITSMSGTGYGQYGRHFLEGARQHLDPAVTLRVYHDSLNLPFEPRVERRDTSKLKGLSEFLQVHKQSGRRAGNYNQQADRFAYKSFSIVDAGLELTRGRWDVLVWLDADIRFLGPVTAADFLQTLPITAHAAYLGRIGYHTEGGFYAWRSTVGPEYFRAWRDYYATGAIYGLPYMHDCGIFDDLRAKRLDLVYHNLSPYARKEAHPFIEYWKGKMDHLKGPMRKLRGHS